MDNQIVELFDESGESVKLKVIASLKIENIDYAILHDERSDIDLIFKVKTNGQEDEFILIDEGVEQQQVIDAFYELNDKE